MKRHSLAFLRSLLGLGLAVGVATQTLPSTAHATLDENESSVDLDMAHMKTGKRTRIPHGSSHILQIESDASTVRQFADSSGHIYAIAWSGQAQPDLSVLLGRHYIDYSVRARTGALQRGGRGPRRIETAGVVVLHGGHMRQLRGVAYLPNSLPAGVNPDDLQ